MSCAKKTSAKSAAKSRVICAYHTHFFYDFTCTSCVMRRCGIHRESLWRSSACWEVTTGIPVQLRGGPRRVLWILCWPEKLSRSCQDAHFPFETKFSWRIHHATSIVLVFRHFLTAFFNILKNFPWRPLHFAFPLCLIPGCDLGWGSKCIQGAQKMQTRLTEVACCNGFTRSRNREILGITKGEWFGNFRWQNMQH